MSTLINAEISAALCLLSATSCFYGEKKQIIGVSIILGRTWWNFKKL